MEMNQTFEIEELSQKLRRYLVTALLVVFVLMAVTAPFAAGHTYAGRSEAPDNVLTYTPGNLTWDRGTGIDPVTGVAQLNLFQQNADGERIIMPGDAGTGIIRLENSSRTIGLIQYTAVVYAIPSTELLPVTVSLEAEGAVETSNYMLPAGVRDDQVILAVTGSMADFEIQDFNISWTWDFYESDVQDQLDTMLAANNENITVGVYIVVNDDNKYINPKTSDTNGVGMYAALMFISALLLVLLFVEYLIQRRWEAICEETSENS